MRKASGKAAMWFAAFFFLFAWASPGLAQSATASQGTMAPSGHVPFVMQDTAVVPPPEQLRMRDEAMSRANRPGPPVPVEPGFVRRSPALPPTDVSRTAPRSLAPSGPNSNSQPVEPDVQQNAPGDMTYFLTHDQPAFSGQQKSPINEPSVGTAGSVVFVSSNWDAAYSTNRGSTFTFVDPTTTFPTIDGGFCCDQTVIYARSTGTMIWQLQYSYSATTQKNTYRIAFAPAASVASAGWCYYDFNPQMAPFNQPVGANFDYPDVALSNNFVYFTARVFPASGSALGTAIWRIPLAQASQCQAFTFNGIVFTDAFTFSLAQGATTTMYWFRHISTSQERLFNWPENSGTISWNDVNVTTWFDAARSCPGPDALNWCNRNNGSTIGRTTWVAGGVIGTMWGSSQGGGRAYPYTRVARFNESTKALINEPDIWNPNFAFIYPSVNVNDRGHLGGVLFYGGGSFYPNLATLIWDDFSSTPAPWELYQVVASSAGATAWGDYSTTRRHGTNGNTWVGTGQFKPSASAVHTYYLWFGRERDSQLPSCNFASRLGDFSGDARSDILWRNVSGALYLWLMNGVNVVGEGNVRGAPNDWHIVSLGAFDGSNSDILWRHDTGQLYLWLMNSVNVVGEGNVRMVPIDWHVIGTSDFNGDGRTDILWRHDTGSLYLWLMNSFSVVSERGLGTVPNEWRVVSTSDFNGDNRSDILWRHDTGALYLWFMNSFGVVGEGNVRTVPNDWSIVSTSDFNGDGRSDILWRHTSGALYLWLMNGLTVVGEGGLGTVPNEWRVVGTNDFNGDGRSDILWRHTSGVQYLWLMNGLGVVGEGGVRGASNDWNIAGPPQDRLVNETDPKC